RRADRSSRPRPRRARASRRTRRGAGARPRAASRDRLGALDGAVGQQREALGDREVEPRAAARIGFDPDPAEVRLDEVARDREAQPRAAFALTRDLLELLEHALQMLRRDAVAVVLHAADE